MYDVNQTAYSYILETCIETFLCIDAFFFPPAPADGFADTIDIFLNWWFDA